jgi:hypothetical protein
MLQLTKDFTSTPQAKAPIAWGLTTPLIADIDECRLPDLYKLDVGVRLGARSRQVRSYNHFIKKAKFRYKYKNTL